MKDGKSILSGKGLGGEDNMGVLGITVVSEEQEEGLIQFEKQKKNKTILDKLP